MKIFTKVLYQCTIALVVSITFISCNKKEEEEVKNNNKQEPQISFVVVSPTVKIKFTGTGDVMIYWGDQKTLGKITMSDNLHEYSHDYESDPEHTVRIVGNITTFYCNSTKVKSIDVSKNKILTHLYCYENHIKNLDLSGNLEIIELNICSNSLKSLDVSKNKKLKQLFCHNNYLDSTSLNELFQSLPDRKSSEKGKIVIWNNPGFKDCDIKIAENKNWEVVGNKSL